LRAEIQTTFSTDTDAGVICLDANTRSLPAAEATRVTREIAKQVAEARPRWFYKKCDSVLRGHVLAEIRAIQAATGRSQALLLSANPARGRIIRRGEYYVNGQPLHQTAFANDPEHPRLSAKVTELLGGDLAGVRTPDAETTNDLDHHAVTVDAQTLPAGGVEFFEALLRARSSPTPLTRPAGTLSPHPMKGEGSQSRPPDSVTLSLRAARGEGRGEGRAFTPQSSEIHGQREGVNGALKGTDGSPPCEALGPGTLFVCGSAAAWAKGRAAQATAHGVGVYPMPPALLAEAVDASVIVQWAGNLATDLRSGRSVMAAIGQSQLLTSPAPAVLVQRLAHAVAHIMGSATAARICAEGGATARAMSTALGWTRFAVRQQLAGGVVELQPLSDGAPAFILKVGSYDWPEGIWTTPPGTSGG
jgi:D-threonate/D-erythronate kinase